MTFIRLLAVVAMVVAVAACATKPAPHKLENSAPGDNGAPTASSW